ncbi:pentatricopeptide repeat-containing protein At1g08070, chloroplastic [Selaginella moellendorffii]|nr:pentatricopeptide repeat-containing protein At1g08070, chloroplastic [Selaginella moellendorffii]|eukprot:XP_002983040.2 pentatricopeptide repeat-containing protein At1g08070, chloroplastic [Selaginella moellendorffii]
MPRSSGQSVSTSSRASCGDVDPSPRQRYCTSRSAAAGLELGDLDRARDAFDSIRDKNIFSWTLLFTAFAQLGYLAEARAIFDAMPGKDVVAWTAMLAAYSQHGFVDHAKDLFDRIPGRRDTAAWNAMIAAYDQNCLFREAISTYRSMLQEGSRPNQTTIVSVLDACAGIGDLDQGIAVHDLCVIAGVDRESTVGAALVNMYGKCGQLVPARAILDKMYERDLLALTAMLTAYAHSGHPHDALKLFVTMDLEGIQSDHVAFVGALHACTSISAVATGKIIHEGLRFTAAANSPSVANSLVAFYGKCGYLEDARGIFDGISRKSCLTWNTMLGIYSNNGFFQLTLELYLEMSLDGVLPDEITFVILLSACSHGGMIRDGCYHFASIKEEFCQIPVKEHYMCVLDLLSRSGQLQEAEDFFLGSDIEVVRSSFLMDMKNTASCWTTLLSASKVHGDSERGKRAGHNAVLLDRFASRDASGVYMLLSDIYNARN